MPGSYYPGDREGSAREYLRTDLHRFAKDNQMIIGPIDYTLVQDTAGPYGMTHRAMVAWAPAVRNVHPNHVEQVQRALNQRKITTPLVLHEYQPELVT